MSKTADNLVYEVGGILGYAVPGEALQAIEYDLINGQIDPVLAEISDIVYVGDRDDIPDRYFKTIAQLVALHAQAKFGNTEVSPDDLVRVEARLRQLASSRFAYSPVKIEYL